MTTVLQAELDFRDRGAERALEAAEQWKDRAWDALNVLAATHCPFTADHLIGCVGLPNDKAANANNAVGGVFLRGVKRGVIRETGRRVPSTRDGNHGRRQTEWVGA